MDTLKLYLIALACLIFPFMAIPLLLLGLAINWNKV
jgi:hypothetical protein